MMIDTARTPGKQVAEHHIFIDVTPMAARAGFTVHVAVTAAIWADTQRVPARWIGHQDASCRLWDLLLTTYQQLAGLPREPTQLTVPMEIDGVRDYAIRVTFHQTETKSELIISHHDER